MADDTYWQTKLHARLHDPAEKALVLLRDPAGHEGGTSRALHRDLGFHALPGNDRIDPDNADILDSVLFKNGIPITMYKHVKRADWWASAADRPQWPLEEITVTTRGGETRTRKVADWAQVRWSWEPILVHPLTGKTFDLKTLVETDIADIKQRSFDHFSGLVVRDEDGDAVDWEKTLLACWRFGPELAVEEDDGKLGVLWPLLPADTRVPDHSIWDHLDLTSAFAGAFAADPEGEAALLALSIGPVQSFIAAARTTSDLWAGSHLLSRLAWEAMKVVCKRLGPDAILFPRLRDVPQVDVWLRDEMGLPGEWFQACDWTSSNTDANPLFAAALPNRFVALVPRAEVHDLTQTIEDTVRGWLQELGQTVVKRLLEAAKLPDNGTAYCYDQMRDQLQGFPEVHWAAVPFSLIQVGDKDRDTSLDTTSLSEAMSPFFGVEADNPGDPGFLGSPAWEVLRKNTRLAGGATFFAPNPGVLYPAVHDLSERVLAAAKAIRPFKQTEQKGWRCSLTGETEWLTTDPDQLGRSYRQQTNTLWSRVATEKRAWAKNGEHLGALPAFKRLWPTLFAEEVAQATGAEQGAAHRFVVSTHTMALAGNLVQIDEALSEPAVRADIETLVTIEDRAPALPRALAHLRGSLAARVPAALDRLRESDEDENALYKLEDRLAAEDLLGHKPETYYALLMLDGDHMGRILSGEDENSTISYRDSFHPKVRRGFDKHAKSNPSIKEYGDRRRAVSPNRHLAVSAALNDFALRIVPEVVEREHKGRVIYAGGDDVLAMLPVADLLPVMRRLREAYSGDAPKDGQTDWSRVWSSRKLVCKDGFAYLRGQLMRMMGGATASCGAVIAHHQAPLGAVLRELREAEQRAKQEGGRDAFSLAVLKRSGGALRITAKWGESIELLVKLREFLADPAVSRRAVYHSHVWLRDLPDDADPAMLGRLLGYQLRRQTARKTVLHYQDVPGLAQRLAGLAAEQTRHRRWLTDFLCVAEFLAREVRSPSGEADTGRNPTAVAAAEIA